ncbi:MAG: hypothetical protein NTX15_03420 [Candidatus Kapabacteria bacterium]|nr:hypothetical protein [Candidatus Kapabacteria bacterium]
MNVLFLCTGNSCRSQMGEGWARALLSDRCVAYSAGLEAHGINPMALSAIHHSFDDPPALAEGLDDEEVQAIYRRVRDEIREFVVALPAYFVPIAETA